MQEENTTVLQEQPPKETEIPPASKEESESQQNQQPTATETASTEEDSSRPAAAPTATATADDANNKNQNPPHPEEKKEARKDYIVWPREVKLNDNSSGRGYEQLVEIAGAERIYTSNTRSHGVSFWRVSMTEEEAERASKIPEVNGTLYVFLYILFVFRLRTLLTVVDGSGCVLRR